MYSPYTSNKYYDFKMQTYNASCDQLLVRKQQLDFRKKNVHRNDKFKFRYMLIIPSIIETKRILKEEKNIKAEERYLEKLLFEKRCNNPIAQNSQRIQNNRPEPPITPSYLAPSESYEQQNNSYQDVVAPRQNYDVNYYSSGGIDYEQYYEQFYGRR